MLVADIMAPGHQQPPITKEYHSGICIISRIIHISLQACKKLKRVQEVHNPSLSLLFTGSSSHTHKIICTYPFFPVTLADLNDEKFKVTLHGVESVTDDTEEKDVLVFCPPDKNR